MDIKHRLHRSGREKQLGATTVPVMIKSFSCWQKKYINAFNINISKQVHKMHFFFST